MESCMWEFISYYTMSDTVVDTECFRSLDMESCMWEFVSYYTMSETVI